MNEPLAAMEDLLRPIPGEDPGGPWLRREGTYEALREAMREAVPDAYGAEEKVADWRAVLELARSTLRERSKDLYVAVCLAQALGRVQGFAGLADGLSVIADLHARFWDSFWPRPREGDLDSRVNQLEKLRTGFPLWIRQVPITEGSRSCSWSDWKYAGGSTKSGDPWPVRREEFEGAARGTSREFLNKAALACKAILERYGGLLARIRERYGKQAPSIAEVKESTREVLDALESLLRDKGGYLPEPGVEEAERIVEESGSDLFETGWLAERIREGVPFERLRDSVAHAVFDHGKGVAPKEGWPARVGASLAKGEPYRAVSKGFGEEAPAPAPAPAASVAATRARARGKGDPRAEILACAHALRRAAPGDPASYLVLRAIRWSELRALPSPLDPASLPAPSASERKRFGQLFEQEKWGDILEASEAFLEKPEAGPWLDLQRYAIASMTRLGGEYAEPKRAASRALAALVRDLPTLPETALADGTAAADDTTKNWIRAVILAGAPVPAPVSGGAVASGNGASEALLEANRRLEQGKFGEAITLLEEERRKAGSLRDRFLRRLEMAEISLQAKRGDLALPLLEDLEAEIDRRGLEGWESSDFCARVFENLRGAYRARGSEEGERRAVSRLARLDIRRVLEAT